MVYSSTVKPKVKEYNLADLKNTHIYITTKNIGGGLLTSPKKPHSVDEIPWTKYSIKETDFRVKTATITTPTRLDLTTGVKVIRIVSKLHENFVGEILSSEYTENSDGTYTYQCQDLSREFQSKYDAVIKGDVTLYRVLQTLLSGGRVRITDKITEEVKETYATAWSGLRPAWAYNGKRLGNPVGVNMMAQKAYLVIRNKSRMDAIRDICHGNGYVDVYFSSDGVLQIEPLNIKDWQRTGLRLTMNEVSDRSFKFDTTNAITSAVIQNKDSDQAGTLYSSKKLTGLDLKAFFGYQVASASNPSQSSSGSSTTKATTTTKTSTTKTSTNTVINNKYGNPFNNKKKKIFVNADRGSCDFKNAIIRLLKKDGWSVTSIDRCYGDAHSESYRRIDKSYAVNLCIYNGMCAGTIKEVYDGWLKNKHKKLGVALVNMWDTERWTAKKGKNNPKGDWYHRHGDMSDYYLKTAWDWNRGGSPVIPDVEAYFKKYNVLYCCGTTPSEAYDQFKAGGYYRWKENGGRA